MGNQRRGINVIDIISGHSTAPAQLKRSIMGLSSRSGFCCRPLAPGNDIDNIHGVNRAPVPGSCPPRRWQPAVGVAETMRMRDIAEALGVSTMTVSRALRVDASVAPETRNAILKAIEERGYVPDQIAASLSSRKSGFVAVLVPSLNNPHFSETVLALNETFATHRIQPLIGSTNYDSRTEASLVRAFLSRKPEALVLTNDGHQADLRRLLARTDLPVVEIWDRPEDPIQHVVGFSNREAMRDLTLALMDRGYRNIVYVGENADEGTRSGERRRGFVEAQMLRGVDHPRMCSIGRPPATMSDGEAALAVVMRDCPGADLIMCVSDPLAFGVINALKRRGLRVPEDIAVAGFGDFEISRIALPAITTVKVDPFTIGRTTAELILTLRARSSKDRPPSPVIKRIETATDIRASAPGKPI
ncbi:MAG: LacI family DNA-binding transcriptional regulator [Phreatobacter sp.]|nr:LacI family DNA-binding transcriptional regulator [Phreatobacter sp.]